MTNSQKAEQAALNNALWCDAVCDTHGCSGEFREAAWVNFQQTPMFYPNAVTLGGAGQAALHRECVQEMLTARMPVEWAIKDSFGTLELNPLDLKILFEGQWLYRSVTAPIPPVCSAVQWEIITTASALQEWEIAWSGESDVRDIFRPALLRNEDVAIIAARCSGQIVAGAIANRTVGCVGISNIFVPTHAAQEFRNGCIASALAAFPALPLVGYESGSDVADMQAVGFEVVGELRVWLRVSETV